eukprot:GHVS01009771.1.p1 GENE.GHVS01009771.1~~GHVS01009771.1.p1  ORF type:complete len:128 (-),score=24.81 GHVS01009771.1:189-572(-)
MHIHGVFLFPVLRRLCLFQADRQHVSSSGEDLTGEVKRYTEVLNDTQQMLPDTQRRLTTACVELRKAMKDIVGDPAHQAIFDTQTLTLNGAMEEFPEITAQLEMGQTAEGDKQALICKHTEEEEDEI